MSATWRHATDEESEQFCLLPAPESSGLDALRGVYPAISGVVMSRDGNAIEVPDGYAVKVLDADTGDVWCHKVIQMVVEISGHQTELRPQTCVALFRRKFLS